MRKHLPTLTRPPWLRLAPAARLTAPLVIAVATVVTACSSSSASSPPHAISHAAQSGPSALAFAACMRSHGVPNFPDPSSGPNGGVAISAQAGSGIDPNSPAYQSAMRSCQSLMPAGQMAGGSISAAARAKILRYSACMRSHGEPSYPDPTFHGSNINFGNLSGIDPNSAQYQSAMHACASLNPMSGARGSK